MKKNLQSKKENVLILYNIRSVENVGAIFRTADACGVDKVYLVGYTPMPLDRFGRKRSDLAKSALGAEEFMLWEHRKSISPLIKELKKKKFQMIAIEQDKKSINYKNLKLKEKNAFIAGPEVEGIKSNILEKCDVIVEIPMKGKKESLNVSVACGIVLFNTLV